MSTKFMYVSAVLLFTVLFISCKKKKDIIPETITYPNFSQLKVGNYWIYQQYKIDKFGVEQADNVFDSCYIDKDTTINNQLYFKMIRPSYAGINANYFLRDSLHYLVNHEGKILFSSQDFTSVLNSYFITAGTIDTVCQVNLQMKDKAISYSSPAGTFVTSNAMETYNMYPGWDFYGNERFMHRRFAENIGIIMETLPIYASLSNYVERRLVRYHLN